MSCMLCHLTYVILLNQFDAIKHISDFEPIFARFEFSDIFSDIFLTFSVRLKLQNKVSRTTKFEKFSNILNEILVNLVSDKILLGF